MNQLKSRLLRQQELARHPHQEVAKKAPRNLSEVTSAFEVNFNNPPLNQYSKPTRYQILEEQKTYNNDLKMTKIRRILDEIEHQVEEAQAFNPRSSQMKFESKGFESVEGTASKTVLKKSNITFKSQNQQAYQTNQTNFQGTQFASLTKRPTTEAQQQRQFNINYHMEQIRSLRNIKNDQGLPERKTVIKDGESDIAKVQESSLKQLTSIIKPQMTNEEIRRIDKQLSVQKNLIERAQSLPKAPFFPNKRTVQNRLIYNEIFVLPKQKELEKLKQVQQDNLDLLSNQKIIQKVRGERQELERIKDTKNVDLNHSNMMNESQHDMRRSTMRGFSKISTGMSPEKLIKLDDGGEQFIDELNVMASLDKKSSLQQLDQFQPEQEIDIIEVIMKKFNSMNPITQSKTKSQKQQQKENNASQSVFTQQIHVQCPDGYNASVAAPLAPGGGWAPSLPAGNKNIFKTSLQDMTMRARAGIQIGDVQKEAHMAFCLGVLNEKQDNHPQAVNFYKRFFFCARMLDDPVGASLALNRIGVSYYKKKKIGKSLKFHLKHCEFTDKENIFASYYNIGICYRIQNSLLKAIEYFSKALEWAQYREDYESECICYGQLGIVALLQKQSDDAIVNFERCLNIAREMNNDRLQLDCLLCLGYIGFDKQDWATSKKYFDDAYFKAKQLNENHLAEQCLCNAGIASGNIMINQQKQIMDQFYRTSGTGFGGFNQQVVPNDDEDEEEEEEEEQGEEPDFERMEEVKVEFQQKKSYHFDKDWDQP